MISNKFLGVVAAKFTAFVATTLVAVGITACADSVIEVAYTPEESAKLGFNFDEGSDFKNPPADKARVFLVREKKTTGFIYSYYIYYQYNPTMDENNKPINEKDKYEDNLIGLLTNGSILVRDFEPNKPLMFKRNLKMNFWYWVYFGIPTLMQDSVNRKSYWLFTPDAGKVYCVAPVLFVSPSESKDKFFLNKESCEKLLRQVWGDGKDI